MFEIEIQSQRFGFIIMHEVQSHTFTCCEMNNKHLISYLIKADLVLICTEEYLMVKLVCLLFSGHRRRRSSREDDVVMSDMRDSFRLNHCHMVLCQN